MKQAPAPVRQNVLYSIFDYVSQPATMILAAPVLLKTLGVQQYCTWMLINSIAATASGLGGGFGDGATKFVSMYRGRNDQNGVTRSLVAALAINVALGCVFALAILVSAPLLIDHVFHVEQALRHQGITALRISAVVLLLRFADAVFISAIRGYERYRPVVITSVSSRVMVVLAAVVLARKGFGLVQILWVTLAAEVMSGIVLILLAKGILQIGSLRTIEFQAGLREVLAFGSFTWLKSFMGVAFGYADRLIVAAMLGTGPLAFYVLCSQVTQPISAVFASGFSFLFPHVSARCGSGKWQESKKIYHKAVLVSTCIVGAICLPVIVAGRSLLALWLGAAAAGECYGLLVAMTIGNGILAVSIVPHYIALALGQSRPLAYMNVVAGVASLGGGYLLLRHVGLIGGGFTKVIAGLVSLLAFAIVRSGFRHFATEPQTSSQKLMIAVSLDPFA
jgi:O-antigen/teichoic acid export membrane protein